MSKNKINPWEGIQEDILQTCKEFRQKLTCRVFMRAILSILVLGCAVSACSYLNSRLGLSDDNFIEEILERQIEEKIGIDLDLTPDSKEIYG